MPPIGSPLPARTEITVLSADDPKALNLGFTVREYNGCPIHLAPPGMTLEQLQETGIPKGWEPTRVTNPEALKDGDIVLSPGMLGGLHIGAVGTHDNGDRYSTTPDRYIGFLTFSEDDRSCWVCIGGGNLNAIKKINRGAGTN